MTITVGEVRGTRIHLACATEEEAMLTWSAFYPSGSDLKGDCPRCGVPLKEVPDP